MNNAFRPILLIALALAGVLAYAAWQHSQAGKELVPWRSDYSAAQKEARDAHKPLLVYFTAAWCGPCQQMKATTWNEPAVEHVVGDYVPVKLDIGSQDPADLSNPNKVLARQFNVTGIPHFFVLNDAGATLKEREGYMDSDEFVKWLKSGNINLRPTTKAEETKTAGMAGT